MGTPLEIMVNALDPLTEPGQPVTLRQLAQAALDALDREGFVVVPKEPGAVMMDAGIERIPGQRGNDWAAAYRAMIAAAREPDGGEG